MVDDVINYFYAMLIIDKHKKNRYTLKFGWIVTLMYFSLWWQRTNHSGIALDLFDLKLIVNYFENFGQMKTNLMSDIKLCCRNSLFSWHQNKIADWADQF